MYYLKLFPSMIGPLCFLGMVTYLCLKLERLESFRRSPWITNFFFGLLFGLVAIFATNNTVPFKTALTNMRDASPLVAGLIFGPWAGITAGLVGGLERLLHNGVTTVPCAIATLLAGVVASVIHIRTKGRVVRLWQGFLIGVFMEVLHMLLVLMVPVGRGPEGFFLVPYATELEIVGTVALAMMLFNGLGVLLALGIHKAERLPEGLPA